MDSTHVKYSPEKKPIGTFYWEVWQGLPKVSFKTETLEDAIQAWSYSRNGYSIWIPQTAINSYKQDKNMIFIATAERNRKGSGYKTEIKSLRPYEGLLKDAIDEAKDLNREVSKWRRKYKAAKF